MVKYKVIFTSNISYAYWLIILNPSEIGKGITYTSYWEQLKFFKWVIFFTTCSPSPVELYDKSDDETLPGSFSQTLS